MRFAIRRVRMDPRRQRGAHEAFAANRRAPMMLAIQGTPAGTTITLFVKPRPTLLLLAACTLAAYVGGGLGLAWWFNQKPHNRIHAADLMLPWRWSALRDLRGQMFCAQGVEALRRGEMGQGVFLVRRGLAEHPNDAPTRLVLAEAMVKIHDYEAVREAVLGQLAFPPVPRPLLELLVNEARRVDDAQTIAEAMTRAAAAPDMGALDHRWVQLRRAAALNELRQPAAALEVLADSALATTGDAAELRVDALCALGRADEAIALADKLPRAQPGEPERRLRLLARAQRHAGHRAESAAALRELIALNPAAPEPRIYAIEELWAAGMVDDARRELDSLLRHVSAQPGAVAQIVNRLADDDAPALLQRCIDEARALGQPVLQMLATLSLACVSVADWDGAERAFDAMFGAPRKFSEAELLSRTWLRAVIDAGRLETEQNNTNLRTALGGAPFALSSYVRTANGFARAERWEALQILAGAGLAQFRRSVTLNRRAEEARAKLATRPLSNSGNVAARPAGASRDGTGAPREDASTFTEPVRRGPDLAKLDAAKFNARINEHLQRGEWDAAADLITAVRWGEPPWFSQVAPELDWHEARIAFARDDRLRMLQAIGLALRQRRPDVERAIGFAREFARRGDLETAQMVAHKITEAVPESASAKRYLAELEQKGAPPK